MADATITIAIGGQVATFTVPDAAVQRIIPMADAEYRQYHPGEEPTPLQVFAAGLWAHLRRDVLKYERKTYNPPDLDMGGAPESEK